jgi:hypothetical protein
VQEKGLFLPDCNCGPEDVREFQDQRCLAFIHLLFKSALVKSSSHSVDSATVSTEGDKSGTALMKEVEVSSDFVLNVRDRMGLRTDEPGKRPWQRQHQLRIWTP